MKPAVQNRLPAVISTIGVEATVLARQVLIARLFGAETLGQFLIIVMLMRCVQMITDLAADRFLITRPDADVTTALATIHGYNMMRGFVCALLMIAGISIWGATISGPVIVNLCGAAIVKGFAHQGYRLQQRDSRFSYLYAVELLPVVVATLAIWPLAMIYDPGIALASSLAFQAVLEVIASHMVARAHAYRVTFLRVHMRHLLAYGWPLLGGSVVLFISIQGERLIFSHTLTVKEFAIIGSAIQLAMIPALMAARLLLLMGLPVARAKGAAGCMAIHRQYRPYLMLLAVAATLAFAATGNWMLASLYGPGFAVSAPLLALIAAIQAGRVLRAPDSVIAQSIGQTHIPLQTNLLRASAILPLAVAASNGMSLAISLVPLLLAEVAAYVLQQRALKQAMGTGIEPFQPGYHSSKEATT